MKRKLEEISKSPKKLIHIKEKLLNEINNPNFGDIQIQSKDKVFYINSGILNSFSESEVFEKMFTNGMEESNSKIWDLSKFDSKLVQELILSFFNIVEISDENLNFFLEVSHLYEFKFLMEMCECFLGEKERSLQIAVLAKMYNLDMLLDYHIPYLVDIYEDIHKEEDYKSLGYEIQSKIVNKKIEKMKDRIEDITTRKHHCLYQKRTFGGSEHIYCLDCEEFVLFRMQCYHIVNMDVVEEKTLLPFCHKCGNCLNCQKLKCQKMKIFE
jgi:hypothetical protein